MSPHRKLAAAIMLAGCAGTLSGSPAWSTESSPFWAFMERGSLGSERTVFMLRWIVDLAAADLELTDQQRGDLDALVTIARQAFQEAEGWHRYADPADHASLQALPLMDQVSVMRTMAQEADAFLEQIEPSLEAFYSGLSDDQRTQLHRHIAQHRGAVHGQRTGSVDHHGHWYRSGRWHQN
jgi:hypothetical protein